ADLLMYVGHDFFYVSTRLRLQPDKDISGVRLGQASSKLQAGPPRIGVDLRRGAQNLFDLAQEAIGVPERGAGWRDVIEDETAFVHSRHEAAADLRVGEGTDHK